jgi:hypothetical protein
MDSIKLTQYIDLVTIIGDNLKEGQQDFKKFDFSTYKRPKQNADCSAKAKESSVDLVR